MPDYRDPTIPYGETLQYEYLYRIEYGFPEVTRLMETQIESYSQSSYFEDIVKHLPVYFDDTSEYDFEDEFIWYDKIMYYLNALRCSLNT